ncbi:WD40 repeat protein [Alteromonadaceae bacterium 2753L.S.0a.02]|nr:WD40 repeat protein [Alteromonadaceae bacterium 2753L.S.0a.02]
MDDQHYKYWAFISYSHADNHWGEWLHKALERHRIPKREKLGITDRQRIPKRLYPVFRDREELSASHELGVILEKALDQSRTLVVICSPHSAASKWVNQEIEYFQKLGREDRIFCLIVDGEPGISPGAISADNECFPTALRYKKVNGSYVPSGSEPIAADARKHKDGKQFALLKLIAGILHVPFDHLRQRDAERRSRLVLTSVTSSAAISVIMIVLAWYAYRGQQQAEQQQAELLVNSAMQLAKNGEGQAAINNLLKAMASTTNEDVAEARLVSLLTQRRFPVQLNQIKSLFSANVWKFVASPDNKHLAILSERGELAVLNNTTQKVWQLPVLQSPVSSVSFSKYSKKLAIAESSGLIHVFDTSSEQRISNIRSLANPQVALSDDGKLLADHSVWKLENITEPVHSYETSNEHIHARYFLENDALLSIHSNGAASIYTGANSHSRNITSNIVHSAISVDRSLLAVATNKNDIVIYQIPELVEVAKLELESRASRLQFSSTSLFIASITGDLITWNIKTRQTQRQSGLHNGAITSLATMNNGVLTSSWDGTAKFYDSSDSNTQAMLHDSAVFAIYGDETNGNIITGGTQGNIYRWHYPRSIFQNQALAFKLSAEQIQLNADFSVFALRGDQDKTISIWRNGEQRTFTDKAQVIHIGLHPDGHTCIWLNQNSDITQLSLDHEWQIERKTLFPTPQKIMSVGKWNQIIAQYDANNFRLWNIETNKAASVLMQAPFEVEQILILEKENLITAASGKGKLAFWDLSTGLPRGSVEMQTTSVDHIFNSAGFIFAQAGRNIDIYSVEQAGRFHKIPPTISLINTVPHPEEITSAVYSPTNQTLYTATVSGVVRSWHIDKTGTPAMLAESRRSSAITVLANHPNGKWLLIGKQNGEVEILDIYSEYPVADTLQFNQAIVKAAFDRDGNKIFAIDNGGSGAVVETGLHLSENDDDWLTQFAGSLIHMNSKSRNSIPPTAESATLRQWQDNLITQYEQSR